MKTINILEQIVKNNGNCDWLTKYPLKDICQKCPLSKLYRAKNGANFLSCYESIVGGKPIAKKEADILYLQKAQDILIDLCAEELLMNRSTNLISTDTDISKERDDALALFMVTVFRSFFSE